MHVKQARIQGERELRIHHLAAWRESTLFVPRERAALAWTEVLTRLPEHGVPDDIYERVRTQLSEKELSDLSFSVMKNAQLTWDDKSLAAFLSDPQQAVPGNRMPFAGVPDPGEVAELVKYLKTLR